MLLNDWHLFIGTVRISFLRCPCLIAENVATERVYLSACRDYSLLKHLTCCSMLVWSWFCVCHKLYQNHSIDWATFRHSGSLSCPILCHKRLQVSLVITLPTPWTWALFVLFHNGVSTVASVVSLVWPLPVYHIERTPLFTTYGRNSEHHTVCL